MITVTNLSKSYKKKKILNNINTELKGITGIIGPNGAGKTTFMKILAGVINSDHNSEINYKRMNKEKITIGYLPQNFTIYPDLSVSNVLKLLASLKEVDDLNYIEELLINLNLMKYKNIKLKNLSGGTLQRVGIAQALIDKPDFLIIDEPTAGLDLIECIRLRELLLKLSRNIDIIISSHIPEDITFICNHIIVIDNGKKRFEGSIEELIKESRAWSYEMFVEEEDILIGLNYGKIVSVDRFSDSKIKITIVRKSKINHPALREITTDFSSAYFALLNEDT